MNRISATKLRAKFPQPIRAIQASGYRDDEYCVGGALCKEMGIDRHGCNFPTAEEVRRAICAANHSVDTNLLTDKDFYYLCAQSEAILELNDIGHFDAAWALLSKMLRWKPKLQTIDQIVGGEC